MIRGKVVIIIIVLGFGQLNLVMEYEAQRPQERGKEVVSKEQIAPTKPPDQPVVQDGKSRLIGAVVVCWSTCQPLQTTNPIRAPNYCFRQVSGQLTNHAPALALRPARPVHPGEREGKNLIGSAFARAHYGKVGVGSAISRACPCLSLCFLPLQSHDARSGMPPSVLCLLCWLCHGRRCLSQSLHAWRGAMARALAWAMIAFRIRALQFLLG